MQLIAILPLTKTLDSSAIALNQNSLGHSRSRGSRFESQESVGSRIHLLDPFDGSVCAEPGSGTDLHSGESRLPVLVSRLG